MWGKGLEVCIALGLLVQSVMRLAADPGVLCFIPAQSYTFVVINHEIISTVILLLPLIQEGLLSVTSESMCTNYCLTLVNRLVKLAQEIVW